MTVNSRTRYNVWHLLADVGGFNDGMHLLATLILSSYSAFSYKKDLLSKLYFDKDSDE